ncbi:hypothetical protein Dalk_4108 [Desulfatibacillum aliphaticivorans]|uniref:Glucosyl-3-phosphoglycerate synthase n=1 Tax=Desulfatibacillum aliphaticivorans TaxID=218208 RepID=B8FM60_DESAL|nr:hypothetical protein [Desulfatibacillum aliphaticivorans]ACL05793.1 hypothetical protein Dalk_4108 [Desulfatibacillum aliphaticivorans]
MTLEILGKQDRTKLKGQLRYAARTKKPVLVMPCLATEYTLPENRPVFENILKNLRQVKYLHKMIFGLDAASLEDAMLLRDLIRQYEIKDAFIQWNSGPVFSKIYDELNEAGFGLTEPGKGKNMFLSFGLSLALGAGSTALVDADIRSFSRVQLDRLLYPLVVLDFDFSKAFYTRISERKLFGRVTRLMLKPLLTALKRRFVEYKEYKMLGLIDFLMQFKYQLSGEVAFERDLLRKMRFATNWGVEIFTLIEVFRKAAAPAQVEFSDEAFDHKHQIISPTDSGKGLNKMAIDIVTTLMNAIVREEGLEITDTFFRDIATTYQAVAETSIKNYSYLSRFNNLIYDRDHEEFLVKEVFKNSILQAGEILTARSRVAENFLKVVHTFPEFKPFLESGLADAILSIESKLDRSIFEIPQTVSWERVETKIPDIYNKLRVAIKEERAFFEL